MTCVTINSDVKRIVVDNVTKVIQVVGGGLPGPPGPAGDGGTLILPAGEVIHGRRVVMVIDGLLYHPNQALTADAKCVIGVAETAASAGGSVTVRTAGPLDDSAWTWPPGLLYCGPDGVLVQSPPSTGWLLPVARVVSPTSILVAIGDPTVRTT